MSHYQLICYLLEKLKPVFALTEFQKEWSTILSNHHHLPSVAMDGKENIVIFSAP